MTYRAPGLKGPRRAWFLRLAITLASIWLSGSHALAGSPEGRQDQTLESRAAPVREELAAIKKLQPGGATLAYLAVLQNYRIAFQKLEKDILEEIRRMPEADAVFTADEVAQAGLAAALASPASTALEIAELKEKAVTTRQTLDDFISRHETQILAGLGLPRYDSPELFVASQTRYSDPFPLVGAHGPETEYYPEAPWQVELQWAGYEGHQPPYSPEELHACGGALIAPDWVLTAAHCVWDRETGAQKLTSALQARGGSRALADLTPPIPIAEIHVHKDYQVSSLTTPATADIALLRLARPMDLKDPQQQTVIPFARPGFRPPAAREAVTASGWGATEEQSFADQVHRISIHGQLQMSPLLRIVPQRVFDQGECAEEIRDRIHAGQANLPAPVPVHPGNLCAGGISGTCQGDSGGPLVAHSNMYARRRDGEEEPVLRGKDHPVVFGVVSWGAGCKYFTVFTRVSAYADWIDQVLRGKPSQPKPQPALAKSSS